MTRTMTCREGVSVLMDYTEDLLPPKSRSQIEEHVSGCRRCQGFVRSYREIPAILRRATEKGIPVTLRRRLGRLAKTFPDRGTGRKSR